jgi:arylsulfatase A-like enzyme
VAKLRSDYLGRAALVDHGIGAFVRAARRRPDAPRTWVVASADHGKLLGESGLLGHRSFLFPAIDVPVVVASLGAPKPDPPDRRRCDVFASTVDVVATIAALAGCDLPKACVGRSLLPAAQGQALSTLASEVGCLSEFGRRLMLQTDRYKIVLDVDTRQVTGVYDLLNDPQEKRNLTESVLGCNLMDALRWRVADALLALRAPDPSLDNGPPA